MGLQTLGQTSRVLVAFSEQFEVLLENASFLDFKGVSDHGQVLFQIRNREHAVPEFFKNDFEVELGLLHIL